MGYPTSTDLKFSYNFTFFVTVFSGVSWGCIACACTPGGLKGAPKRRGEKERSKERERNKGKKRGAKEGEKGRERKYAKEKEKREEIKRKLDIKRKTHGWLPVSDNRKRLKEKEPMKKETRQERTPRYLKF